MRRHSGGTARAIAVLAHEASHLRGVSDESTTESYAIQSGVGLGPHLSLSERESRRLMRQALSENTGRGTSFDECRAGGELDLSPEN